MNSMRDIKVLYRTNGILFLNHLLSTRIRDFSQFQFPKRSLLHYYDYDEMSLGPDEHLFYLEPFKRRILIDNILSYDLPNGELPLGTPRAVLGPIANRLRAYFFAHRKFRLFRDPYVSNKDPNIMMMLNYGYLNRIYKYIEKPLNLYYKWYNLFNTIYSTVNKVAEASNVNQFLFIKIPASLPSLSQLHRFNSINHAALDIFDTEDLLIIRDIYAWIYKEKMTSVFSILTDKALQSLNLIFFVNNKYYWISAYHLFSFNKVNETTMRIANRAQPTMLARIYINSLINLNSSGIIEVNPEDATEEPPESEETIDEEATDSDDTDSGSIIKPAYSSITNAAPKPVKLQNIADVESDIEADRENSLELAIKQMEENLDGLEQTTKLRDLAREVGRPVESGHAALVKVNIQNTPHEDLSIKLDAFKRLEVLTGSELKTMERKADLFHTLRDPQTPTVYLKDSIKIAKEELEVKPDTVQYAGNNTVLDKTMLRSTLDMFDRKYLETVYKKDVNSMVVNLQRAGIIIEDYKVEKVETITDQYEIHSVRVQPIDGIASTIYFKLPIMNESGEFMVNQTRYRSRKQRGDLPIKKIGHDTVALTSYYGKLFVIRNQRKSNSLAEYLFKSIFSEGIQNPNGVIRDVKVNSAFDNLLVTPRIYSSISLNFESFKIGSNTYVWNHKTIENKFPKEQLVGIEKDGSICCGYSHKNEPIIVKTDGEFFVCEDKQIRPLGDFYNISGIAEASSPIEFTSVKIFSKELPLVLVLGYYLGLEHLLSILGVKYRQPNKDKSLTKLLPNEYAVVFKDTTLIFNKRDMPSSLIVGGLTAYKDNISKYRLEQFSQPHVYFNLLAEKGFSGIYIKEMDLLKDLFIDPITSELLETMHEPRTFVGLLLKANELLAIDAHPDDLDMRTMRIKGNERMAGIMYNTLVSAVRSFRVRNNNRRVRIDISPNEVFRTIMNDPANILVSDINPIQTLKQDEAVTYLGEGGRTRQGMNKESRRYHPTDMGIISEATISSGDVAINTYLSANPLFNSLRGTTSAYNFKEDKGTSLLSTSALVAPGSMHDDPKRVNFVSIQQSHTVAAKGYRQPYVRTGYESIIPQRLRDSFAYSADEDGVVESITSRGIVVRYNTGKKIGVNLGRVFGRSEGSYYPQDVITLMKEKSTFKRGDIIAFTDAFFEEDILAPGKIILRNSMNVRTALYESSQTWEDSSAISNSLSERLTTKVTKVRSVVVDFTQDLRNPVKIGSEVSPLDTLVIIEDPITAKAQLFNDSSISTLKDINSTSPKAKVSGVLDSIEVYYNGDKEDMTAGLRFLADLSDKITALKCKDTDRTIVTGRVTSEYRVEGVPLALDQAEIKFYITFDNAAGVGDKGVFANQLKSVFGEVMDYDMTTETGEKIDAVFGQKSIDARIVLSPEIIGTTTTLLRVIAKHAVQLYNGD